MFSRKVSTTVYLSLEQSKELQRIKKETHVPTAEIIRVGIDMVLEKIKKHGISALG